MTLNRRSLLASAAALLTPRPAFAQTPNGGAGSTRPLQSFEFRKGLWTTDPGGATSKNVPFFGIDGQLPAPILRVRLGSELRLQIKNSIEVPALLNWHGVRLPAAQIGNPLTQPQLGPGEAAELRFTPPDAGTFFYQPPSALLAQTPDFRGLSGILVVEEPSPPPVDDDVVLALDDWPDGPMMVNGKHVPVSLTAAPGARIRFRIVNLSTLQAVPVGFNGLKPLVITIDGQPCDAFEPARDTIPLGPGARFDVLCELPRNPGDAAIVLRGQPELVLATCGITGAPVAERPAFKGLPANRLLPEAIRLETAARADLVIDATPAPASSMLFNGIAGNLEGKPVVSVKRGTAVSLGFVNNTSQLQPIRLHGHVMRLLHALDDGWEPYWRESVIVPPGKTTRIAFVADNPGRWMVESARADLSAAGLWAWFEVK